MRSKILFSSLFFMILFASCTDELENRTDKYIDVQFALDVESNLTTRAISDGSQVTQLMYAVFDENGNVVLEKQVKDNYFGQSTQNTPLIISLARGKTYQVAFWAQSSLCQAYNVSDDMKVTIDYTGLNNNEIRDAFFASTGKITIDKTTIVPVVLKRPFAQINVGSFPYDTEYAQEMGMTVAKSSATIKGVANIINLVDGSVDGEVTVNYELSAIPTEKLNIDINGDGVKDLFDYLSMSYVLANVENTIHEMAFTFADESGNNSYTLANGLESIPMRRNCRTNIVGQILSSTTEFDIKIDPIYDNEMLNSGGIYYNFNDDVVIEDVTFSFDTNDAATFTSENNNTVTLNNVTFSGRIEQIAMGEYRDKGNYVAFTNIMNNVVAKDMVVDHPGISCVETIDYMAPLFFLRGETTLNNCTITGTTTTANAKKDWNGKYHEVIAYDCGVPNKCNATFNNCTIDKLFAWSHSQITINGSTMKYIRCATHNYSDAKAHLTIGSGSIIDEIVVTSSGQQKFVTIDGKKTLIAEPWAPALIIKAGATVKRLDMNGRPRINKNGVETLIIEDGAIVNEIINLAENN